MNKTCLLRYCFTLISAFILTSCVGVDQLSYDTNMPLKKYYFKDDRVSMELPELTRPQDSSELYLYSKDIRTTWRGIGVGNFPITDISVLHKEMNNEKHGNVILLRKNADYNINSYSRYIDIENLLLRLVVGTTIYSNFLNQEKQFLEEDNAFLLKLVGRIRVMDKDGKSFRVQVNETEYYQKFNELLVKEGKENRIEFPIELVPCSSPDDKK